MKTLSAFELEDLHEAVTERIETDLLPALTKANRTGDLPELLDLLGMGDLVDDEGQADPRPTRVVVLGDAAVSVGRLASIARKNGFDSRQFEFALGYEELQHYKFAKLRGSYTYAAVLVGPIPHSTPGKHSAGSAIAEMKGHPEIYPPIIEVKDSTGLKITNNSFARALLELKSVLNIE